ncbi:universal stress protein [Dietzia cinnamea]|uniref:Nucleotide-binding universal stress UspA family protein n=1 Tax=Dietzia cinnamea TaxID=321318 RepID=A0A4R3ZTB8_9ACTN|nr:universal stress protein [Dietzia cinnamea]TCW23573.1 nucleotide-binding universal stress UspA family protein [Dietzia cinnamea]
MTVTATGPIVCGYDGSQDSRRAVTWAAARARGLDTPLEVISADRAVGRVVAFDDTARANVEGAMRDQLADLVGDVPTTYRVIADSPVGALVEAGRGASAIVVGSRGLTVREDFAMGSTSAGVVEHATCPVIVITPHAPADPTEGPVVLAADGSEASSAAVAYAFSEAERRATTLRAVHSVEVPRLPGASLFDLDRLAESVIAEDEKEVLDSLAPHEARHPGVEVELILVVGEPAVTIADEAAGASLLVTGSRGHGGFAGLLLGSVSRRLLQTAPCPVAVVRPTD